MEPNPAFREVAEAIVSSIAPLEQHRYVYSLLREIYIHTFAEFLKTTLVENPPDRHSTTELLRKRIEELRSWLTPPVPPLTTELALDMISKTDSPYVRDSVLRMIGKRGRRGQPVSKRHLAIFALDAKYAFPAECTLRQATNALCPCGRGVDQQHTAQCMEQFRQQINRAVKLLKSFGYDFTWDRIGKPGWNKKIE